MGDISRLFISGVVNCTWNEYKELSPYEQVAIQIISNESLRYQRKLRGAKK